MPAAFTRVFSGLEGPYAVRFEPAGEWDGVLDVVIGGLAMRWVVEEAHAETDGGVVLGGMTSGSKPLWNNQFWFELRFEDQPPVIRYWGDRVLVREDRAE